MFYFLDTVRNSFINGWAEGSSPDAGCSSQDGTKRKNVVYLIKRRKAEIFSN